AAYTFQVPWLVYLLVGLFLLCLIRFRPLRELLAESARRSYRGLRFALVELPARIWKLPWIQGVFRSLPFLLLYRYVLKPLILTSALWVYWPWTCSSYLIAGLTFLGMNLLLYSRPGRAAGETATEALVLVYSWLRFDV